VSAYCRLLPFGEGRPRRREHARLQRQPREFCDGLHPELRRDRSAVQFHRPLVDAEIAGNLLVEPPLHDVGKHFEFPFAESVEPRAQGCAAGSGTRVRTYHGQASVSQRRGLCLSVRASLESPPHHPAWRGPTKGCRRGR